MGERESFLNRVERGLSRISARLAARQHVQQAQAGAPPHDTGTEALRSQIERARQAIRETAHEDLDRVLASVEGMKEDYGAPLQHSALRPGELEAFRRLMRTTARSLHDRSNLDTPDWDRANEEYDRSWADVERAFESEGDAASP
jgi:hypothetical protein